MKNSNLNSVLDQTYPEKTRKCCDVTSGKVNCSNLNSGSIYGTAANLFILFTIHYSVGYLHTRYHKNVPASTPTHNKSPQQNEDDFNWLIWYITTRKVVQEIRDCGSKPRKTMEKIKFFDEKKVDENID